MDGISFPSFGINSGLAAIGKPYLFDAENNYVRLAHDENITEFRALGFLSWIHVRPQREERLTAHPVDKQLCFIHSTSRVPLLHGHENIAATELEQADAGKLSILKTSKFLGR
ncbi:MAG: hypothetical protein ACRD5M_09205 [Candidatus Acidiferrales bacterium]